ncbi:cytochrome c oxidase subunit 6B-1-like protein [Tanacetum coccineum]
MFVQDHLLKEVEEAVKTTKEVFVNENPSESDEQETTDDETVEIKLETAPGDYRFPTTNQSRHCFTRYVEYHRCVAAKGDGAPECDKFAKYYRSLCPGEWVDRWNEQRENGTFPGSELINHLVASSYESEIEHMWHCSMFCVPCSVSCLLPTINPSVL